MSDDSGVLIFNPLPWERELAGPIANHVVEPRGEPDDHTAGRHFQDRDRHRAPFASVDDEGHVGLFGTDVYLLQPTEVPGYGYSVVPRDELLQPEELPYSERGTVETDRYRMTFDRERGGVSGWYDKELDHEWVDATAEFPFGGFVHERVADTEHDWARELLSRFPEEGWDGMSGLVESLRGWQPDWHARRTGTEDVLRHRVYETPLGIDVRQRLAAPQIESDVAFRVFFPDAGDQVVVDVSWEMGLETRPEATYLAFPFAVDEPVAHLDVGGQAMRPGRQQLAGSCHDYYHVQRWTEISNSDHGVTVGCPLNPLVQFGDFHFAENQHEFSLDRGLLLGWVTNNYWETNFRAHQPGIVWARYHLTPHAGAFDEAAAHRRGLEAEHWMPVAQTLGEGTVSDPPLPPHGQLLNLPDLPILTLQVRPDREDTGVFHPGSNRIIDRDQDAEGMLVVLRNVSDSASMAAISSAALQIQQAERRNVLGSDTVTQLDVSDGTVSTELNTRETATIWLDCAL